MPRSHLNDLNRLQGRPARGSRLERRGMSSILFVVALPALLMFVWLGVEFALVLRAANQAKIAADAIALAAAARLPDGYAAVATDATAAAAANRAPNGPVSIPIASGNDPSSDLVFGSWDEATLQFVPDAARGTAVQATVRFAADNANGAPGIILAGLFKLGFMNLQRTSVAVYNPPSQATTLLIEGRLWVEDNATVDAFGGISVAYASAASVVVRNEAEVTSAVLRTMGDLGVGSEDGISGAIYTYAAVPTDPYADATPPTIPTEAESDPTPGTGTVIVPPGWYPDGLEFTSGTYDLSDGIFHLGGGGLIVSGDAAVVGGGRLIHLTESSASVLISDSGSVTGSGYADTGEWSGVSILQPNAGAEIWRLSDTSELRTDGLLVAADATVRMTQSSQLVAGGAVFARLNHSAASSSPCERVFIVAPDATAGRARLVD